MATPNEKLAASLHELATLQAGGGTVFRSDQLSRVHRERLVANGFLGEACRGWLYLKAPGGRPGDSTPWYASIWEFCARYCDERFGEDWHLSAEQSVLLHAESTTVPPQILVFSLNGANNRLALPFDTSVYDLKERAPTPGGDIVVRSGLRLLSLDAALSKVPEAFYARCPLEAQTCLASMRDTSAILARLLDGGNSTVAGRIAGAFRHIGRPDVADEILSVMRSAGYRVTERNPFDAARAASALRTGRPAIVNRLRSMWSMARPAVLDAFPPPPGPPPDPSAYLAAVDDIYVNDAYHSLSIEGYRVTAELIERVRTGAWDPDNNQEDKRSADAMAARGYWQAFEKVKTAVSEAIRGRNAAGLVRVGVPDWYREMFQPAVLAGTIRASELAGFRRNPVYLRTSRFVPPRHEIVPDAMDTVFDLLDEEQEPSVRAVLGHWMIGYIHPFPDGNGRTARFLMNVMLASGGYPWTIIRLETRQDYLAGLDRASIDNDVAPFARFIADSVSWSWNHAFGTRRR